MKNPLILIIFIGLAYFSFGQTELIAYKSHSGDLEKFNDGGYENLGIPPLRIDTIVILNDSTIIEISSRHWSGRPGFCVKDTVVNHPMYQKSSDYKKLKGTYYDTSIVFINYDTLSAKEKKRMAKKQKKENSVFPVGTQFPNSGNRLLIILSLFMGLSVVMIWQFNKRKISA